MQILKEKNDNSECTTSKDYEANDNEVQKLAFTLLVEAKSLVAFLEKKQLNSLIQFFNPIKCSMQKYKEDVTSVEKIIGV